MKQLTGELEGCSTEEMEKRIREETDKGSFSLAYGSSVDGVLFAVHDPSTNSFLKTVFTPEQVSDMITTLLKALQKHQELLLLKALSQSEKGGQSEHGSN